MFEVSYICTLWKLSTPPCGHDFDGSISFSYFVEGHPVIISPIIISFRPSISVKKIFKVCLTTISYAPGGYVFD